MSLISLGLLAIMAAALPLTAVGVCVAITFKRRRTGVSTVVPRVVAGLVVAWILAMVGLELRAIAAVAPNDPTTKATVLSLALSETLNFSALFVLLGLPLMVPAYFVDRRLRRAGPQPGPE